VCTELPGSGDRSAEWRRVCLGNDLGSAEGKGYGPWGVQLWRRRQFLLWTDSGKIPSLLLTAPVCEGTGNRKY
jgi:hypothetical protein